MSINGTDEALVRQYLLGMLPESEWDGIEQKLLTDDDFAGTVEIIEDEIVDDYLHGALTRAENRAAEDHFFQSPEHRYKLHFARLLRSHLRKEPSTEHLWSVPPGIRPGLYWSAAVAMPLLFLLTVGSGIYVAKLRRDLQSEMAKSRSAQNALQAELTRERTRTSQLEAQLKQLQNQNDGPQLVAQDSSLILTLHPLDRSQGNIPFVKRTPAAKRLEIHVPTIDFVSPSYEVTLRDAQGKELWSHSNLKPKSSTKPLVFKIPLQLLSSGEYSVVINGSGDIRTYYFQTS